MDPFDDRFLSAAGTALGLLSLPEVERRWDEPSVLAKMSVGMLACHLARQLARCRELLPEPAELPLLDSSTDHYHRADWVLADSLEDPANDRSADERSAAAGWAAMLTGARADLDEVQAILKGDRAEPVVAIPWQGWSLRRADFLLTRSVELVVHSDDLARSVGVATPGSRADVFAPVLHLLADLAAERRGQASLVSALSRSERQPDDVSAF